MSKEEKRIRDRYFRKTRAHPEGSVTHHGDCDFFSIKICTCGMLHDLSGSPGLASSLYPLFSEEMEDYEEAREKLLMERPFNKKH